MLCTIFYEDKETKVETRVEMDLVPVCGEDMCDSCGDCLHCYEEDECPCNGGEHYFVLYEGSFYNRKELDEYIEARTKKG